MIDRVRSGDVYEVRLDGTGQVFGATVEFLANVVADDVQMPLVILRLNPDTVLLNAHGKEYRFEHSGMMSWNDSEYESSVGLTTWPVAIFRISEALVSAGTIDAEHLHYLDRATAIKVTDTGPAGGRSDG